MKVFVRVKPRAKQEKTEKVGDNRFDVWVKEPPMEGKANEAVCRVMARYFSVPLSSLKMVSGSTSRQKVIEIQE